MKFTFKPSKAQLRVFSAVCSNLAAGWFVSMFLTSDLFTLTGNVVGVIISLYLAMKAEQMLEEL